MSVIIKLETGPQIAIRVVRGNGCSCPECSSEVAAGFGDTFPEAVKEVLNKMNELHDNVCTELGKLGVKITAEDEVPEVMS